MVPGFPHTPVPLTVPPEAMSRALDCILVAVLVALYLEKYRKYQGLLLTSDNLGHNEKIWLTKIYELPNYKTLTHSTAVQSRCF